MHTGLSPIYLATAEALDEGMRQRIERHRERRGDAWQTIEEPIELARRVALENAEERVLLVDCLSMWVTNLLLAESELGAHRDELVATLRTISGPVILVSSETSLGLLPMNDLARRFLDECGLLHQACLLYTSRCV